ncbi:hypothetical protein ACFU9X_35885 [Streptomyces atratus]|uniref:hypothetical protein n=1 Tax=Streptomyces atratus TaxID=1893 RepID=UPI003695280B
MVGIDEDGFAVPAEVAGVFGDSNVNGGVVGQVLERFTELRGVLCLRGVVKDIGHAHRVPNQAVLLVETRLYPGPAWRDH